MNEDFFDGMPKDKPAYEAIVARIARSLHSPDSFDEIEIHAHLKPGLEVPLMGIASMPGVLHTIYQKRLVEDAEIRKALTIIIESKTREEAEVKLGLIQNGADAYSVERLKQRVLKTFNLDMDKRILYLEKLEARLLTHSKRLRYEHAENLLSSMVKHLYQITMAIEGKRAAQGVDNIKAIVLHEQDMLEALGGGKKPGIVDRVLRRGQK